MNASNRPREWDATSYDALPLPHERWGRGLLATLALRGDERVADVGAGTGRDTEALLDALNREEIGATLVQSKGGFLREGNATVFIGVDEDRLNRLFSLLSQTCRTRTRLMSPSIPAIESGEYLPTGPVEVEVGGATLFVLPVERYERI